MSFQHAHRGFCMLKVLSAIISFFIISTFGVFAQQLPDLGGVAVNVEVADGEATTGNILSITKEGLKRSQSEFDIQMYGIIVEAPVLSVAPRTDSTKAVLSSGIGDVKVSAEAGVIEVGDYITSSAKSGVGKKANSSGYVLGKALGNYDDTSKDGAVSVDINIGFVDISGGKAGGATERLANTLIELLQNPQQLPNLLRYIVAFLIALFTFIGSTFSFIKFMSAGITAIGRNPLAKGTIIAGMVLAGTVISVLTIAGFATAAFILGLDKLWQSLF